MSNSKLNAFRDIASQVPTIGSAQKKSFANINPIRNDGVKTIQLLRHLMECAIPKEALALNELIEQILSMDDSSDMILEMLGDALVTGLRADTICKQHTTTRVVGNFADDAILQHKHEQVRALDTEIKALTETLNEKVTKIRELMPERWELAVTTFGLAVDSRLYKVNEEDGTIEQITVECKDCEGVKKTAEARMELAKMVVKYEENKDD